MQTIQMRDPFGEVVVDQVENQTKLGFNYFMLSCSMMIIS